MTTFIYNSYSDLRENLNSLKTIKLNIYLRDNDEDFYDSILVDADSIDSDKGFNTDNLGYDICTFDDNSD